MPYAFIAVRTVPSKLFSARASDGYGILGDVRGSLSDRQRGLMVFNLPPALVHGPEASFQTSEDALRATVGQAHLVEWV